MRIDIVEELRRIANKLLFEDRIYDSCGVGDGATHIECLVVEKERLEAEVASLKAEAERLTPREMSLQDACDVLNRHKHKNSATWREWRTYGDRVAMLKDASWWLDEAEAVYIAQGLERDAKGGA